MHVPKRIPTLLGLFFAILIVGGLIFLTQGWFRGPSDASPAYAPTDTVVTNITDTSFTVTWLTADPATGLVEVNNPLGATTTSFDERDQTGKLGAYTTHSVTVRSLKPNITYTFSLLSQGKKYLKNDTQYHIETASPVAGTTALEPAYGAVVTDDNEPASGAIVYLTLEGGQTFSALVKASGSWLIPLNLTRTKDLTALLAVSERINEDITVSLGGRTSSIIADTLNDSPMPQVTIGQDYDFRKVQAAAPTPAPIAAAPTTPSVLGAQVAAGKHTTVSIVAPTDKGAVASAFPNIYGTGIPGKFITITLGITHPVVASATVGADGIWRYTPTKALGIGKQSITITTKDITGKAVAITHTFDILKSGTQVLGDATPSATLEDTPAPTLVPTLEIIDTPIVESTDAGQPIPVTGSTLPVLVITLVALLTMATGAIVGLR